MHTIPALRGKPRSSIILSAKLSMLILEASIARVTFLLATKVVSQGVAHTREFDGTSHNEKKSTALNISNCSGEDTPWLLKDVLSISRSPN